MIENKTVNPAPETHPFQPFIPDEARVLIMGTFPPKPERWNMKFYYPNRINDFWRIMGIVFYDNAERFWDEENKKFRLEDIRNFLTEHGIAMSDTGRKAVRLRDNASDKYLEIVEPVDLQGLLMLMPYCRAIATTGEKAAKVISGLTCTPLPAMGESVEYTSPEGKHIKIFRMPSTSRAFPMAISRKADYYRILFKSVGLI